MIGSATIGISPVGGAAAHLPSVALDIPSVPDNESPYTDPGEDVLSLLLLEPMMHFSVGLYTHTDGKLYLIKVASGKIYAGLLLFTSAGDDLQRKYISDYPTRSDMGGDTAQSKLESYVLGQAEKVSTWVEIGAYRAEGFPIHYGWNFNWDGDKAVVVTQKANYTTPGGDTNRLLINWTSRVYTLTIIEEDESPFLSATVSMDVAKEWEPTNFNPLVWKPSVTYMAPYRWSSCESYLMVDGYGENGYEGDVYAFYDDEGKQQIFSFEQRTKEVKDWATIAQEAREAVCNCYGNYQKGLGVSEFTYSGSVGGYDIEIKSNNGISIVGEVSDGGYYHRIKLEITTEGAANSSIRQDYSQLNELESFVQETIGDLDDEYWGKQWKQGEAYIEEEHSTLNVGGTYIVTDRPIFVLPAHSSETIYLLMYQHILQSVTLSGKVDHNSQYEHRAWGKKDGWLYEMTGWMESVYPRVTTTDPWDDPCPNPVNDCKQNLMYFERQGGYEQSTEVLDIGEPPDNKYKITNKLVTATETTDLPTFEDTDFYEMGRYQQLVSPNICGELADVQHINNYQSVFGNSIRWEDGVDWSYDSNNAIDPAMAEPYALWLGRS